MKGSIYPGAPDRFEGARKRRSQPRMNGESFAYKTFIASTTELSEAGGYHAFPNAGHSHTHFANIRLSSTSASSLAKSFYLEDE